MVEAGLVIWGMSIGHLYKWKIRQDKLHSEGMWSQTILVWIRGTDVVWIDATKMFLKNWKTKDVLEDFFCLAPGIHCAFCGVHICWRSQNQWFAVPQTGRWCRKPHSLPDLIAHQAQDLSTDVERNAIRTGAEDTTDSFALPDSCTLKSLSSNQIPLL